MPSQIQEKHFSTEDANRISQVTVFTNNAQVTRQLKTSALPGINRYTLELTAFDVDHESAQAKVFAQGEILGVQYLELPAAEIPQQDIKEIDDQKRGLNQQKHSFQWRMESIQRQIKFLDSLTGFAEVEIPKEIKTEFPPMDRFQDLLGFLDSNYGKLGQQERQLDYQIKDLDYQITALDRRLKQLRKTASRDNKVIEVIFNSDKTQDIKIEVSYVVNFGGWQPVYKIDVDKELDKVNLTMFARIQQRTGEAWENVMLSLSNALPMTSMSLPELHSWYLRPPLPVYPAAAAGGTVFGSAESAEPVFLEAEDGAAETAVMLDSEVPAAEFAQAEQKELPITFEYDVTQGATIRSSEQESLIPLTSRQLKGEFYHYTAPGIDPLVYLVCRTTGDNALMAGRLNIHFDGRFIGGTILKEKKPGEDLLLNLGPQRGIKVRREKVLDTKTETFFGMVDRNSVARELKYRIVVENLKENKERLQIIDNIPISTTDRFQIKGLEMKPEPIEKDWKKRDGVMKWELDAEPNKPVEIYIHFFVKHPKDLIPAGL